MDPPAPSSSKETSASNIQSNNSTEVDEIEANASGKRKLKSKSDIQPSKKPRPPPKELEDDIEIKFGPVSYPLNVQTVEKDTTKDTESTKPRKIGESPAALKNTCKHFVSLPRQVPFESYNFQATVTDSDTLGGEVVTSEPAKTYKFELDAFQRQSIRCLERRESVLVAAHTSAGKTAVAEYAIAMAKRDKQRVIYTSPIKALSNQKFRELEHEFTDVGLMTGDVTINKNASCLVMTTEILRSMLYRGSEIVREVAWVIFDEVHYMRDKDRGVVWEESIILLPENVRFVFLSATIPNAQEFAEWVVHIKNKPCHTIYTDTRPVPLQHFVFPSGGSGIHLIVNDKGEFRADNFEKALAELKNDSSGASSKGKGRKHGQKKKGPGKSDVFKIVKMVLDNGFYPAIVFSFSRKEVEGFALQLGNLNFNNDEDAELVEKIYNNALASLDPEDQNLPQIQGLLQLLKRGIGIHHSGLLPIAKEIVEILFAEGLVKLLFATETFAMGLNMPARTVIFTGFKKFDGKVIRPLLSGEFVQMSGRAGRRGQDERGTTILMMDEMVEAAAVKNLMTGAAEPLVSKFHLGYNMLLNLMRAEEANPEFVIKRSLAQFQSDRSVPKTLMKIKKLQRKLEAHKLVPQKCSLSEDDVTRFFKMKEARTRIQASLREHLQSKSILMPFLQPGRLIHVYDRKEGFDYRWALVVRYFMRSLPKKAGQQEFVIEFLCRCRIDASRPDGKPLPFVPCDVICLDDDEAPHELKDKWEWKIVKFSRSDVESVSAVRVNLPENLSKSAEKRKAIGETVREIVNRLSEEDGVPLLDPFDDFKVQSKEFATFWKKQEILNAEINKSPVIKSSAVDRIQNNYEKKQSLSRQLNEAGKELDKQNEIILQEELEKMRRVLRRLEFVGEDDVVHTKGRVACEVNTADELVLTEFLLEGNMNELSPAVLTAVLSCFVVDEKKIDEDLKLEKDLECGLNILQTRARRVATVLNECNIPTNVDEYVEGFNPVAMRVVRHWCEGNSFQDSTSLSDMFEGSVIRCLRRLEELLRQLVAAAKNIGNSELESKFEECSKKLKRGIAFSASLYT